MKAIWCFSAWSMVDGVPLSDLTEKPVLHRREIVTQIAKGLDAAHQQAVVHGDIKPANIMVAQQHSGGVPRVVIMDFGLARALTPKASAKARSFPCAVGLRTIWLRS